MKKEIKVSLEDNSPDEDERRNIDAARRGWKRSGWIEAHEFFQSLREEDVSSDARE